MNEPDYQEIASDENRRLLRSFGYWDIVALGAVVGAGLGFLHGLGDGSRQRAADVFAGMVIGALVAFITGLARVRVRARERFFARWAEARGWTYRASGEPFEDTPYLCSGDKRRASDFFSGFWPRSGAVLYQHKRIVGSGRSQQVNTYVVLHLSLARPLIDLLQISPRSRAADVGEKLFGHHADIGAQIELESIELIQDFGVSSLHGLEDEAVRLLTPSAMVKILDFHHALPDAGARFEIQGSRVAFLVEETLSPKRPQAIDRLLECWQPIAAWLIDEAGATAQSPMSAPEGGRSPS